MTQSDTLERGGKSGPLEIAVGSLSLVAFNLTTWAWAWMAFHDRPALLGSAVLAYAFGLRHAFDADHIAAIDNVVRKLLQEGRRSAWVGFFFSLGHATVVVLASIAIATATTAFGGHVDRYRDLGQPIGTLVSAVFLLVIGVANLLILRSVWNAIARLRKGTPMADFDPFSADYGILARLFRPMFGIVSRPWHMYPVGFLFGLGFDTATEIGLLGMSATQAAAGVSVWSVLVFPTLFTAGMALMDTADSVLMTEAYSWSFARPIRKLWYNLTITAASVFVALFVGGLEALGLVGESYRLTGWFWRGVDALNHNLTSFGFVVVVIFLASWAVSTAVYKSKGLDALAAGP